MNPNSLGNRFRIIANKASAGSVFLWALTLLIIGYTATRSVHLVSNTLPEGAEQVAYFALFALDFALLIWEYVALYSATSTYQFLIAVAMTYIQIVAVAAVVIADTMLVFFGNITQTVSMVAVWIIPFILGINLIMAATYKIVSPENANGRLARQALADAEGILTQAGAPVPPLENAAPISFATVPASPRTPTTPNRSPRQRRSPR